MTGCWCEWIAVTGELRNAVHSRIRGTTYTAGQCMTKQVELAGRVAFLGTSRRPRATRALEEASSRHLDTTFHGQSPATPCSPWTWPPSALFSWWVPQRRWHVHAMALAFGQRLAGDAGVDRPIPVGVPPPSLPPLRPLPLPAPDSHRYISHKSIRGVN